MITLEDIYKLEDNRQFEKALDAYDELYRQHPSDYEVWKHYFFLLWEVIEEMDESTLVKRRVREQMKNMLKEGRTKFSNIADFNFIAGYAIAMFPYEFGDYNEQLELAKQMLKKSHEAEPANKVYQYLYTSFSGQFDQSLIARRKQDALRDIRQTFQGKGALNKYFRQVLLANDAPE